VQAVFSLHDVQELRDLLSNGGFSAVEVRATEMTLPLPPPGEFLWQYVYSTPLAGQVAELDDDQRMALERDVVAGWQCFVEEGRLLLRLPITLATARK
jgi:hypothetical protein